MFHSEETLNIKGAITNIMIYHPKMQKNLRIEILRLFRAISAQLLC